ncbi:hypothetical protein Tco_1056606 [Tanacetum coccineum]|uniref:Uncharacterized protein n=1 Tax=Tanacetum coccineum TaxID=301880 RepID=A0ABQ5H3T6_9ASTR
MTRNIAYLLDFKEFNGGYVTFGGGAHSGRNSSKRTLKTDSLDFEDVYSVNELNFNLFSISQMCDKKNYVLFTDTECLVLSPNFKLPDESQILLKIPRKDNMYSFDMKNIVPKESLTCLVAKATSDESIYHPWKGKLAKLPIRTKYIAWLPQSWVYQPGSAVTPNNAIHNIRVSLAMHVINDQDMEIMAQEATRQ